jgi:hypothetical protein
MAGSTSSISLASNALLLLGDNPISKFDEKTTGAKLASNLYESSYRSALTTYRWRFATKKAKLARVSGTPKNDYQYKHKLPSDCLYVIKTNTQDYEIYENMIFSNQQDITIDYTYRVNEDNLPAYFIKMFEFFLSAQFALALTGDLNKKSAMEKSYIHQLRMAKYADSSQRPSEEVVTNPYIDARY